MKNQKFVFVYFENKAFCTTPEQAIAFIDSQPGLTCNSHTKENLNLLFSDPTFFIDKIATTGCCNNRILVYRALAENLKEHIRIFDANKRAEEKEQLRKTKERAQVHRDCLLKKQEGWYLGSLTITLGEKDISLMKNRLARSGADLFHKMKKIAIETYGGNAIIPPMESSSYEFVLIRTAEEHKNVVAEWDKISKLVNYKRTFPTPPLATNNAIINNREIRAQMIRAIRNGSAKRLTPQSITKLKGKKIRTFNDGYSDQYNLEDFIVGEMVTRYQCNKTRIDELEAKKGGWKKEALNQIYLLTQNGENTCCFFLLNEFGNVNYSFYRSDRYRDVFYIELD